MAQKPPTSSNDTFVVFDPDTNSVQPRSIEETAEGEEEFPEDYPDYFPEQGVISTEEVSISRRREDTRGRLAIIYTLATFAMFVLGFAVSVLDAIWRNVSIVQNLGVVLPLISGLFLGTLGFVLGYYFRKMEGDQE
ncbi:MAG: hypothetical protein JNK26_00910 [Candidatus Doudnabacteria bacterium]|nr:hypothetical protein [Candidatus Doudnabacteria bacterium]